MEISLDQAKPLDASVDQRAANELICLIRKLRWIGRDEEAEQVLTQLKRCFVQPTESVLADPCDTD